MIVGALETAVCKGSQELAFFVKGLRVLLLIPGASFSLSLLALSTRLQLHILLLSSKSPGNCLNKQQPALF